MNERPDAIPPQSPTPARHGFLLVAFQPTLLILPGVQSSQRTHDRHGLKLISALLNLLSAVVSCRLVLLRRGSTRVGGVLLGASTDLAIAFVNACEGGIIGCGRAFCNI